MALIGASNSLGGLTGSNALARLLVVISGDSSQLTAALAKAEGTLKGFGRNATSIGNALTRNVTLPFLAIGGAAVKASLDFNAALTRVATLTPILAQSKMSFEQLEQSILDLANQPDITATPTDLANALYYAGSAGLEAADAMDVVTLAAQGQTVGMGDAADIAKVLIFAMNNYEDEALSAADAMDALTVAIREGTADPEDLAVALGRLLPVAHEAGVSFNEVVASVAALTNLGVPARVATTSLRALFGGLLAPTKQATEELDALGITADQLRFKLQQGPLEAFKLITDATKESADATRLVIPQIRALTAYYGLSGAELEDYRGIIDHVNESQGAFKKVIEEFTKTPTFKFQKSLQQLTLAGIELGNELLPVFVAIVGAVKDLAQVFTGLPGPLRIFLAAFLTLGAAAGPVLKLIGAMNELREVTYTIGGAQVTGLAPTWKSITVSFIAAGIAAGVAAGGMKQLLDGSTSMTTVATTFIGTVIGIGAALKGLQGVALNTRLGVTRFGEALAGLSGGAIGAIAVGIGLVATAIGLIIGQSRAAAQELENFGNGIEEAAGAGKTFAQAIEDIPNLDFRADVKRFAELAGVLNQPVGSSLPKVIGETGAAIQKNLTQIQRSAGVFGVTEDFAKMADIVSQTAGASGDLGIALEKAGFSFEDFMEEVNSQAAAATFNEELNNQSIALARLVPEYGQLREALRNYNTDAQASLYVQAAGEQAIEDLARQTGTSTDFIRRGLTQYGIDLAVASDDTVAQWQRMYFGTKKNGELIAGSIAETREAIDTEATAISESFGGMFDAFAKPENQKAPAFDVLLKRMQDVRDEALQTSNELVSLGQRGVPIELLKKLEEQGPAIIHRFAQASDKELEKYVDAFEIQLAAGDAAVLREGVHLESKGKRNIRGFVDAMLTQKNLTRDAAQEIILEVVGGLETGRLRETALELVQDFVGGLDNARNLTERQATKITKAFVAELRDSKNFTSSGELIPQRVAEGISRKTGLPVEAIRKVMFEVIDGIKSREREANKAAHALASEAVDGLQDPIQKHRAQSAGEGLGSAFARGIASSEGIATAYANAVARKASEAFEAGLYGSPRYASYYYGQDYAKVFGEGVDSVDLNGDALGQRLVGGLADFLSNLDLTGSLDDFGRHGEQAASSFASGLSRHRTDGVDSGRELADSTLRGMEGEDLSRPALALTRAFAAGLKGGEDLTARQARQLRTVLLSELRDHPEAFTDSGESIVRQVVRGLRSDSPVAAIRRTITSAIRAISEQLGDARTAGDRLMTEATSGLHDPAQQHRAALAGRSLGSSFAEGVSDSADTNVAQDITRAFQDGLANVTLDTDRLAVQLAHGLQTFLAVGDESFAGLKDDFEINGSIAAYTFIDAMMSQRNASREAGRSIILATIQGLQAGRLDESGLRIVAAFTRGLNRAKGITRRQGAQLSQAFIQAIQNPQNYNRSGQLIIEQVTQGLAEMSNLPVRTISGIMQGVVDAIRNRERPANQASKGVAQAAVRGLQDPIQRHRAQAAGAGIGSAFARGVASSANVAEAYANAIARKTTQAFEKGLYGSPRYASFYYGQDFARAFSDGMRSAGIDTKPFTRDLGRVAHTIRNTAQAKRDIHLNVRLDRRRTARDIDYEYRSRGK